MLIIQIALGIVLAVLILAFLPQVMALGIAALGAAIGLALLVAAMVWLPNTFALVFTVGVIGCAVWMAIQHSKKHNEKDAQDLQSGQDRSPTGHTYLEQVPRHERIKRTAQALFFGGGFSVLCFVGAHQLSWGPLWGVGFIVFPIAIYLSIYHQRRLTERRYATTPKKVLSRCFNVPTSDAIEEGRQRGWA